MPEMTDETKKMISEFQIYQQQLQNILIQKESLKLQLMEIDRALEELSETKQMTAFKITGQIMINKPIAEIKKELEEDKEDIDIRIKSLEKTESRLNEKLKNLQTKLKEIIK